MTKTNFDAYLEEQLRDPKFAERFEQAGDAWDIALQLTALREEEGLSQKELAKKVGTTQQQISRLESPSYEGHSLRMLRKVAHVLHADVQVSFRRARPKPGPAIGGASRSRAKTTASRSRKASHS